MRHSPTPQPVAGLAGCTRRTGLLGRYRRRRSVPAERIGTRASRGHAGSGPASRSVHLGGRLGPAVTRVHGHGWV